MAKKSTTKKSSKKKTTKKVVKKPAKKVTKKTARKPVKKVTKKVVKKATKKASKPKKPIKKVTRKETPVESESVVQAGPFESKITREIEDANSGYGTGEVNQQFPYQQTEKSSSKLLMGISVVVVLVFGYIFFMKPDKSSQKEAETTGNPLIEKSEKSEVNPDTAVTDQDGFKIMKEGPLFPGKKQVQWNVFCEDGDLNKKCRKTIYYDNGNKRIVEYYLKRMYHGVITSWHLNGQKKWETEFVANKRHNSYTKNDENGKELLQCKYDNGKLIQGEKNSCPGGVKSQKLKI